MLPPFDYFQYRRVRDLKRKERATRFAALDAVYRAPFLASDQVIVDKPIAQLVQEVREGSTSPIDLLHTYGKIAVRAHEKTNCVTELLLPEAEHWAKSDVNLAGPLGGIPISLKDTVGVKGFDASVGYAKFVNKPFQEDGPMVRLLKDAGAVPYAKTALPATLLSFESTNGIWGVCKNPHHPDYVPGGSTGGEAALLALGGRIGIGSDVAGSVRVPAAWSGIYAVRCSSGRWPKAGVNTSMAGQEGIPSVYSPMARTLDDLSYLSREIIKMEPWKYDYTVQPLEWRTQLENDAKTNKLRIGVVPPTPAIARAIDTSVAALTAAGHTVVEVNPPNGADPFTGLRIASQILNADGCDTVNSHFSSFEPNDAGVSQMTFFASLSRPIRYLYYLYTRYIKRDFMWATLIRDFGPKSATGLLRLVAKREAFRATWHAWWDSAPQQFDFILCPANASPALPHGAMHDAVSGCGYTFLWNLLDYTAGVIPVSHVDAVQDRLPGTGNKAYRQELKRLGANHGIARGTWMHYNADKMAGLPTAVQIVGRRWDEERVLGFMHAVESALESHAKEGKYTPLPLE